MFAPFEFAFITLARPKLKWCRTASHECPIADLMSIQADLTERGCGVSRQDRTRHPLMGVPLLRVMTLVRRPTVLTTPPTSPKTGT